MKTTILLFMLASISGLMSCSNESLAGCSRRGRRCRPCCPVIIECKAETAPVVQEQEDSELRALLEARRDTLKELAPLIEARVQHRQFGAGPSYADVLEVNTELFQVELECARTPQERLVCFEKTVKTQSNIGQRLEAKVKAAIGNYDEVLIAKAARLKAEIDLYKANNSSNPIEANSTGETSAAVQEPNDEKLHELLEARCHTLAELIQRRATRVGFGGAIVSDYAKAATEFFEAKLELAKSQKERITIYEKMLEPQTVIEQRKKAEWEGKIAPESDFLITKAACEKAAINLHMAKKGKWPLSIERGDGDSVVARESEDLELRTRMVEHRDTLKKIVLLVDANARKGIAPFVDVIATNEAYFEAEIELAKSPQEQVEILQPAFEKQTGIESIANKKFAVGIGDRAELLIATAARLKAEINLYKVRKNTK